MEIPSRRGVVLVEEAKLSCRGKRGEIVSLCDLSLSPVIRPVLPLPLHSVRLLFPSLSSKGTGILMRVI